MSEGNREICPDCGRELAQVERAIGHTCKPKPQKFRKKPVMIEAVQFTREYVDGVCHCSEYGYTHIHTLEGVMRVIRGDWIDEFYPCKPDIFEKTYERVGS